MDFKEAISTDIGTFLDKGEFAEEYAVSMGHQSAVVIGMLDEDSSSDAAVTEQDGLSLVMKRFFVREADLPRPPIIGKVMTINGDDYLIRNIFREMGMLTLALESNDSGG